MGLPMKHKASLVVDVRGRGKGCVPKQKERDLKIRYKCGRTYLASCFLIVANWLLRSVVDL